MQFLTLPSFSLINFDNKPCLILYTMGCDFKCPACHAKKLTGSQGISEQQVLDYIRDYDKRWVKGVVLCGGEPTIHKDLPDFLARLKKQTGLEIKLDTNGNNPDMLEKLTQERLVDYIAMDIKGSRELYPFVTGIPVDITQIERSMRVITPLKHEFRTTLWPIDFQGDFGWMSEQEAIEMVKWVSNTTGTNNHRHYLQKFVARTKEEMIGPSLSKDNLPREMWETPDLILTKVRDAMKSQGYSCEIR
ncbi:anaerobic ribonucleoside-triphosphate reductase activating protein [Candidatus Pacearchaeota archaeon]|nr:anaerobic ribonucleoside-triphosphate reductase activating protein [Candidatus Pacearchaeota archaeon]